MRNSVAFILLIVISMYSCTKNERVNPFFKAWEAPYELPPFEELTVADYQEAFQKGMDDQINEIESIISNKEEPDFKNTIVAFDTSGELLKRVSASFYGIASAHGTPEILKLQSEIAPIRAKHSNSIMMNKELFNRINQVKEKEADLLTDPEDKALLNEVWLNFVRGGAQLEGEKAARFSEIDEQLSVLHNRFSQNLLAETGSFRMIIDKEEDLSGLSADQIEAAAQKAEKEGLAGKWVFGLDNPSIMPFLYSADNRELRTKILDAYLNRCNNDNEYDNKEVIAQLVTLKREQARLLGYQNYPEYALDRRMAKNADNAYKLLLQLWEPSLNIAKKELEDMQKLAGSDIKLTAADWRYYSDKVKADKYSLNDEQLRPYFMADNVKDGIFWVCNQLYGITFRDMGDVSRPHEDAHAYLCIDKDGKTELGILYIDLYARPGFKRGGAWCGSYRTQHYKNNQRVLPITTIVCNFTPPLGDDPALLTPDETETFFHEFGHALHNLFKDVKYFATGGVPRDFVELPSQIMEHWAFQPLVLEQYAKHFQTGEVIPKELVDKLEASSKFGQGFIMTEFLAAALLDMDYHMNPEPERLGKEISIPEYENEVLAGKYGLISEIPPRYRSTYFQHIFSGGYTVGYYSYKWSEVLDCDAFAAFEESGDIFNKELADRFRQYVLKPGGIDPADVMYRNFRGKDPDINPLLVKRGLK